MKKKNSCRSLAHYLFVCIAAAYTINAGAQCVGPVINTFPYSEGFESGPAWTTGGTNNDWAWGTPAHPTINSAGGGTKAWCAGGLTGSFYNYSELSWIQSPCFDFTSLNYPWISLKIFWEDEYKYDGLVLQSSTDGGTTWVNVGAFGDPVDCMNANWYDYNNITWLTSAVPKNGWCGRVGPTVGSCQGTNGSGGWVTAKHCLTGLANKPSVMFRFLFGAGTTCNDYDGIAVDDILIENATPNVAAFTYACAGSNTLNFTNASPGCPNGYTWNFGDPGSGALNTSSATNPSHTYPAGSGTYTVALTDNGPCNAPGTVSIPVSIGTVAVTSVNVTCNGMNNGTATANVNGGAAPYTYSWSPGGQTTQTANGLSPGTYTVNISGGNICPVNNTVTITAPAALTATSSFSSATCGNSNGSATATPAGGTGPYTYSWTPAGGTASLASNLAGGTYTCLITDANACTNTVTVTVTQSSTLAVTQSSTNITCNGLSNGQASVSPTGGTGAYTYSWSPGGAVTSAITGLGAGTYSCTIMDASGCNFVSVATITEPSTLSTPATSVNVTCNGLNNGSAMVNATGGTGPYTYSWSPGGAATASINSLTPGNDTCFVTDANGCKSNSISAITQPAPLLTNNAATNSTCNLGNGTLTVTPNGGTSPYTYSWSSGSSVQTAGNLTSGLYTCVITDANGCSNTDTVTLFNTGSRPVAGVISSGPLTFCSGVNDTLKASGGGTYLWNNGATTSSLIVNASGNYKVVVTNSCGSDSVTKVIIVNPLPAAVITGNSNFCAGTTTTLTASGGASYSWSNGSTSPTIVVNSAGTYTVTASNSCGNSTATSVITVNTVTAHFTVDSTTGYVPFPVNFTNNSSANAVSWSWNFGDGSTGTGQTPTHIYTTGGTYTATLTVTDINGCTSTFTEIITVHEISSWWNIPNVFTPNGDGSNDVFTIKSAGLQEFDMKIYDRWGILLSEASSPAQGWDGRTKGGVLVSDGTYYYIATAKGWDGKTFNQQGFLTLVH